MLKLNDKYTIPECWEELSPEQFVKIIDLIEKFITGKLILSEVQLHIVYALLGVRPYDPGNTLLCENLFRIAEKTTFPFKYVYSDERFLKLSEKAQNYLKKHLPSPDSEDPEIRIAAAFKIQIDIDLYMCRQLLPVLPGTNFQGYSFCVKNGFIETSLTAEQYLDANTVLGEFKGSNPEVLDSLISILYPSAGSNPQILSKLPKSVKMAVYYNYISILEWLSSLSKYAPIFSKNKSRANKLSVGNSGMLYHLSEKGYGSLNEVSGYNLCSFLDILLKQTIDSVMQLHSLKKKREEIAKELNLTIDQINSII